MKRRTFLLSASVTSAGFFTSVGNVFSDYSNRDEVLNYLPANKIGIRKDETKDRMTLYLFVHPMPRTQPLIKNFKAKWEKLFIEEGHKENNVLCLLSNSAEHMPELTDMGKKYFGERCIVDPYDNSDNTKVIIADDLIRTLQERGNKDDWTVYEIWTSNNARRWAEGLKRGLDKLGFANARKNMNMVTCGQQWTGCLTKYSCFMAKYMGRTEPPDQRAELSPEAGFPIKAEFLERISMDRNVYLFLFRTSDGRPMAQYIDGMRGVWEPPHIATVELDQTRVESLTTSPNAYMKTQGAASITHNTFIADVGDGCHPAVTTLISNGLEYEEFRESLANAIITPVQFSEKKLLYPGNNAIYNGAAATKNIPWWKTINEFYRK
jgi:hypothetical protein